MINILFFPTMRCNLKCEYCHFKVENVEGGYTWEGYGKEHRIENEVSPHDVLDFLLKNKPFHLEFSGGEPTLWKGFKELVNSIPEGNTWAVTSNTLGNVDEIDFANCKAWTASYHGVNLEKFEKNIFSIRDRFPYIFVNIVAQKSNVDEAVRRAFHFMARGVRPNILRELNPGVDWRESKEWDFLADLKTVGMNIVEDDIPPSFDFAAGYTCHGGESYFAVMPDGSLYRFYSEAIRGESIGKINEYEKNDEMYRCFKPCLGCAMDHKARVTKIGGAK